MSAVKARKYVLKSKFAGTPKKEDLEIVEETLSPLKDGEFLCEAEWLSVDPYMRFFADNMSLGDTMVGEQVAKVIESKNKDCAVGDYVTGMFGWRTHTVVTPKDPKDGGSPGYVKVDASVPTDRRSLALGTLGMPGATAYFGVLRILKPKAGETLVVNGAAGAVGTVVGQIGKIQGCRVVGFAGSDDKVELLKSLGFDAAYNYKTISSLDETIKEACPKGVDMFFDNVGGKFSHTVMVNLNENARVAKCGAISEYNLPESLLLPSLSLQFVVKKLTVQGFQGWAYISEWPEAFKVMAGWIKEGKLESKETVTEGFDNMFEAFMALFKGGNTGKAVVKA